jgi:prophage regulatory protein
MTSNSPIPSHDLTGRAASPRASAGASARLFHRATSPLNGGRPAQPLNDESQASVASAQGAPEAVLQGHAPDQSTHGPPIEFWTLRDVESAVKLKKSALYARIARREFPRPVKLSSSVAVWIGAEVREWMRSAALRRS